MPYLIDWEGKQLLKYRKKVKSKIAMWHYVRDDTHSFVADSYLAMPCPFIQWSPASADLLDSDLQISTCLHTTEINSADFWLDNTVFEFESYLSPVDH